MMTLMVTVTVKWSDNGIGRCRRNRRHRRRHSRLVVFEVAFVLIVGIGVVVGVDVDMSVIQFVGQNCHFGSTTNRRR